MLLYIGCLVDLWPVQRYSHVHNEFIYVDCIPDRLENDPTISRNYSSIHVVIDSIVGQLQSENAFVSIVIETDDNYVIIKTKTGTIHYYFNVRDIEIFDTPGLREKLSEVDTLITKGYKPVITQPLVNLTTIIHTGCCDIDWNNFYGTYTGLKLFKIQDSHYDADTKESVIVAYCYNCGGPTCIAEQTEET